MAISNPDTMNTTLFQDGQAVGAITPSDIRIAVDSAAGLSVSSKTTGYTLALTDRGTCIEVNSASGVSVTVPPNSSVAFDVGVVIVVAQRGAGQVTIAPGGGVTLRTSTTLLTRGQWSQISLRKSATDEWWVSGDLG